MTFILQNSKHKNCSWRNKKDSNFDEFWKSKMSNSLKLNAFFPQLSNWWINDDFWRKNSRFKFCRIMTNFEKIKCLMVEVRFIFIDWNHPTNLIGNSFRSRQQTRIEFYRILTNFGKIRHWNYASTMHFFIPKLLL